MLRSGCLGKVGGGRAELAFSLEGGGNGGGGGRRLMRGEG